MLRHPFLALSVSARPANILLSYENVPVLVDFGFAERYDVNSCKAFHSNLSYGTPEVSRVVFIPDPREKYAYMPSCSTFHPSVHEGFLTTRASQTSGP